MMLSDRSAEYSATLGEHQLTTSHGPEFRAKQMTIMNTSSITESKSAGLQGGDSPAVDPTAHAKDNAGTRTSATPLSELEQWVDVVRLRDIVWDSASRPSLQWLRKETKRRMIPHLRRGRRIFYRPQSVLEWYAQRESRPATMR